jgi:hypothetical protein
MNGEGNEMDDHEAAGPRRAHAAPAVRTPLWSVRLPSDGNAAFAITAALALFGALWIVVAETAEHHPWLTLALGLPIHLLFFHLISTQRPRRHAVRGKSRKGVRRPFRSDDRSARILVSRR